ncbi:hypothetical protein [Marinomonas mediterranea]|jgi:hypothetical protein|uniref:Uncharacterized protein n=1 Tax=Marinomonas mediterranea (strain ATCC 700492 / JCM 21426 / NBRC 103028 / MMB-1) TaxID=717774 RepID=F2JXF0_MARM1|nr:hypothetical protein [Marinomonas mediterranea]ADZ91850.1 hypothetical protein Marme_2618 [Marinomonas mediterranea MMB-1]WCN17942.1 hypothetical protein GV053_13250 [Marinomonas mediterranea MMB-1]
MENINRLFSTATFLYGIHKDKSVAEETYRKLYPVLVSTIRRQGRDSQQAKDLLSLMGSLPSYGVQRRNFKRRYIDNVSGWKKLPEDPKNFPYGYWY